MWLLIICQFTLLISIDKLVNAHRKPWDGLSDQRESRASAPLRLFGPCTFPLRPSAHLSGSGNDNDGLFMHHPTGQQQAQIEVCLFILKIQTVNFLYFFSQNFQLFGEYKVQSGLSSIPSATSTGITSASSAIYTINSTLSTFILYRIGKKKQQKISNSKQIALTIIEMCCSKMGHSL